MKTIVCLILNLVFILPLALSAQLEPGVYRATEMLDQGKRNYLLLVSDDYLIHSVYESDPAHFVSTMGGFYQVSEDSLKVKLEFNSDFSETGERVFETTLGYVNGKLILNENENRPYAKEPGLEQALDGTWLFGTRGPDTGQERRGDSGPRKTLKFLKDGYFQWIAYNTETMDFRGSGGGRYAADNGKYTEVIQFFSRDDSRVGAELQFDFERKGSDWHHTGNNSRGEPMYEIWQLRE